MRWRVIRSILGKELLETVRDRRTLFAMIVLPVILQPLLMLTLGEVKASEEAATQGTKARIAVWGPLPGPAREAIEKDLNAVFVDTRALSPVTAEKDARAALSANQADLVITAPPDAQALFDGDRSAGIAFFYDSVNPRSGAAHEKVVDTLSDMRTLELGRRLVRHGLPEHFDKPLLFAHFDLASKEQRGGDFAGRILPMLLLIMVMLGAIYPAIDITAGEKERGTLQTLLCAPVKPVEIVAGKYLVVVLVALTSAAVNLGAMGFALSRQIAAVDAKAMQFSLSPAVFAAVFAAMVPAAMLLAALLLGLSIFARSFREAQTYMTPVVTLMMLPGLVATMPSVKLNAVMALVPVVNLSLLVRDLLRGETTVGMYIAVTAASLAYAALGILFAARVFASEQVLLGGEKPWRDVFGRRGNTSATPSPGAAVLFVAVLLVVVYYGSLWIDPTRIGFVRGIAGLQLGLLLLPALLAIRIAGARFVPTLSLRGLTRRALGGTLLLAAGAWSLGSLVSAAEAAVFPGSKDYFEQLTKALSGDTGELPLGWAIVVMALLPAICEEACFRGFVLSGLANTGSRVVAIGGSAIGFGLLHLSPYHIIPAAILGLVLGFATLESESLVAGGIVHLVNNGLAVGAERVPALKAVLQSNLSVAAGVAVSIAGLMLLRGSRRSAQTGP